MSTLTLAQAAKDAGVSYQVLKKHAQRGKLNLGRDEAGRPTIESEDLEAYLALERLGKLSTEAAGKTSAVIARDLGNVIAGMPQFIRDAILDGIPQGGEKRRTGGSEAYQKATAGLDVDRVVDPFPDDPHHGFPIGYAHDTVPKWARVNSSTWMLGSASYSWNGFMWEPGGTAKSIGDDISPASPYADKRPLQPSVNPGARK